LVWNYIYSATILVRGRIAAFKSVPGDRRRCLIRNVARDRSADGSKPSATGMMRELSSVRLIWSLDLTPPVGGADGPPQGFLPPIRADHVLIWVIIGGDQTQACGTMGGPHQLAARKTSVA